MSSENQKDYRILNITGEIDSINANNLVDRVLSTVEKGDKNIILNMKKVDYIFSSGIGVLVKIEKKLRAKDASIRLSCLNHKMKEILEMTGIHKIIEIYDNDSEAIKSLND